MINKNMLHYGQERSAIRELFEQGKALKEKYGEENVFDFSIGNPSVPSPSKLNDTLIKLIYGNIKPYDADDFILHGYTSASGDNYVKSSISSYLNKKYRAETSPNYIYMSVGAAAGLAIVLKAITSSPTEEIMIFSPFFPEYKIFIANAGVKAVEVAPDYNTFYPDINDFKNKINNSTTAIIINSPNNPTGILYSEGIINKISDILKEKEREYKHPIYIISDEPYRELIYDDTTYPFITNYYDNSIITYSFSKSLSIPGERIGYILVNPKCNNVDEIFASICGAGRSLGYVCAPSLFQYLIPELLGTTSDITIYRDNAKFLYAELTNIGYKIIKPNGAFYMLMKALDDDDLIFSKKALSYNLLLVPSTSFGIKGYVRIAHCQPLQKIRNSIPQFKKLFAKG